MVVEKIGQQVSCDGKYKAALNAALQAIAGTKPTINYETQQCGDAWQCIVRFPKYGDGSASYAGSLAVSAVKAELEAAKEAFADIAVFKKELFKELPAFQPFQPAFTATSKPMAQPAMGGVGKPMARNMPGPVAANKPMLQQPVDPMQVKMVLAKITQQVQLDGNYKGALNAALKAIAGTQVTIVYESQECGGSWQTIVRMPKYGDGSAAYAGVLSPSTAKAEIEAAKQAYSDLSNFERHKFKEAPLKATAMMGLTKPMLGASMGAQKSFGIAGGATVAKPIGKVPEPIGNPASSIKTQLVKINAQVTRDGNFKTALANALQVIAGCSVTITYETADCGGSVQGTVLIPFYDSGNTAYAGALVADKRTAENEAAQQAFADLDSFERSLFKEAKKAKMW